MVTTTTNSNCADAGKLILRVTLAILILLHGISKLMNGADFVTGLVVQAGLPAVVGNLVYVGEVLAPLLVMFGLWARIGGLIIAINMVVAILLVHTGDLMHLNQTGGWALELQGMFLATALAVFFLGAGRFSIQGNGNRWN